MAEYNQSQMTLPSGDVVKFVDNVSGYTTNTGTITKVQANGTDVASSGTANIPAASTSAYGVTKLSSATNSSSEVLAATPKAVKEVMDAVEGLPSPMVFKGTLGTGGTITALPTASASTEGYTYKVITDGTYASIAAKVGDVFICNDTPEWVLIPSGDEPSGTVTSVKIQATSPIAIDSDAAITTSGTRTLSHANSGATAGSYGDSAAQTPAYGGTFKVPYVTVNATGHVTGISEHTVKIPASDNTNTHRPIQVNGTQNLGDNTTPLNLKNGSNVSITASGGDVTIAATDTNTRKSFYATCDTAAATKDKVATLADSTGWELKAGTIVGVKFTNTNSYNSTAENYVTLNVNSTGAKRIYYGTTLSPTGSSPHAYGSANLIIYYMYDGTNWIWLSYSVDTNNIVAQNVTTTNADYEVLFSGTADNTTRTEAARKNSNLKFNPSTGNLQATKLNGVDIGSSPKFTDNNTTYTFANGTNGFTVTPSGGSAQTVTVTPSISNNVTGSGTSGYLTKFNGANTITNGPQLGSSTTTYLRNDGTWQTPPNTTNTAGSTDTSSKIFLVGATSQAAAPQTYSDNQVYATNGQLDANKVRVAENVTLQYNSTTKSLDFIFA